MPTTSNVPKKSKKRSTKKVKKQDKVEEPKQDKVEEPKQDKVEESKQDKVEEPKQIKVEESKQDKVEDSKSSSMNQTDSTITTSTMGKQRIRKIYSLNSIIDKIKEIESKCQEEIKKLKEEPDNNNKNYLNNYLRHLKKENRELKDLKSIATRAFKHKTKRKTNPNSVTKSGFLKKFTVSDQVIKFTKWNKNEKYSRNDVTKFICNYIKENNLQNKDDRRIIVPDKKLAELLGYNLKSGEKLTYCGIQKCMKQMNMFTEA